jgi:hypothetical protein
LPELLLLFRIDANHRLLIGLVELDLLSDEPVLRSPVGMWRAFQRLGRCPAD